jgi:hypothetical protein
MATALRDAQHCALIARVEERTSPFLDLIDPPFSKRTQ